MTRSLLLARLLAVFSLLAWLALVGGYLTGGYGRVASLYVRPDLAAVYGLAAFPFAQLMAFRLRRGVLTAVSALLLVLAMAALMRVATPTGEIARLIGGSLLALPAALGVAVLCPVAVRGPDRLSRIVLGAVFLLVPPTYAEACCRQEENRLDELLGQSRFGEALAVSESLLLLDSRRERDGQPLAGVVRTLRQGVRRLESAVEKPLPENATAADRLTRGRLLAMLGRGSEALELLQDADEAPSLLLRATILESAGAWQRALDGFEQARAVLQKQSVPGRNAESARAEAGIAYSRRKLGDYAEAEAAYLRMLALAPTAESHFLLARFYDDAQDATKARFHARQAIALDPSGYRQRGEKLIAKLAISQFGCFGVYREEAGLKRGR